MDIKCHFLFDIQITLWSLWNVEVSASNPGVVGVSSTSILLKYFSRASCARSFLSSASLSHYHRWHSFFFCLSNTISGHRIFYLLHLADGELEINNDIPVGAFLIPNSAQLLAHDHRDVLKHYALIKCSRANNME